MTTESSNQLNMTRSQWEQVQMTESASESEVQETGLDLEPSVNHLSTASLQYTESRTLSHPINGQTFPADWMLAP